MTLQEWEQKYRRSEEFRNSDINYGNSKPCRYVPNFQTGQEGYQELFHLSDWKVSTVTGGTVWLVWQSQSYISAIDSNRTARILAGKE